MIRSVTFVRTLRRQSSINHDQ